VVWCRTEAAHPARAARWARCVRIHHAQQLELELGEFQAPPGTEISSFEVSRFLVGAPTEMHTLQDRSPQGPGPPCSGGCPNSFDLAG
jgi:hypothetical protein